MDNLKQSMRRIQHIHFSGIGGIGMGGIALVLHNLGFKVTGSDIARNVMTEKLKSLGILISYSHIAENVSDCDVVVVSTAIPSNNIELEIARTRRIPIVPRAQMLSELMRFKQGIAVAGTHGKTTTTSMVATIFAKADLDPTFVVGGVVTNFGITAKLGKGEYFIAEADESDASFLHLDPMVSIITNIDKDHLETYNNDFEQLKKVFLDFIDRLPFYGLLIICIDDENIRELLPHIHRPFITYGFSADADARIDSYEPSNGRSLFKVISYENNVHSFELSVPGKHNVLNATAAIVTAMQADIEPMVIKNALLEFSGVGRRLQKLGRFSLSNKTFELIDDYGHHPTEISAVIESVRSNNENKRIVMIYQPHRFTRTRDLFEEFTNILNEVDVLLLLDVYSAGEEVISGYDSPSLAKNIAKLGKLNPILVSSSNIKSTLEEVVQEGDQVFTQGAGSVGKIAKKLVEDLSKYEKA